MPELGQDIETGRDNRVEDILEVDNKDVNKKQEQNSTTIPRVQLSLLVVHSILYCNTITILVYNYYCIH